MKWFAAVLVMECRIGKKAAALWDEQLRLIHARSAEYAYNIARKLGEDNEVKYQNSAGENVRLMTNR